MPWFRSRAASVPSGFLWGVANAGFQVEGGYNGPGEPENNWAAWERSGRSMPAGQAVWFWTDAERHLDLAAGIGLNAFRFSIEWARLQPERPTRDGELDRDAVERYAGILAASRARGLEPIVTLNHFTHPSWLGPSPWVDGTAAPAFERFVTSVVPALGRALVEQGQPPVGWWITINEPNILCVSTYALGAFPPALRPNAKRFRRALDQMLTGHVLAYRAVHAAHEREGWDRPQVTFNDYAMSAYALDRALVDLALPRLPGSTANLRTLLGEGRERFEAAIAGLRGQGAALADRLLERSLLPDPVGGLPSFVRALGSDGALDHVAIDYYVAPISNYLRLPFTGPWRERDAPFIANFWETTIRPEGLRMILRANSPSDRPESVLIAENGMGTMGAEAPGGHGRRGGSPPGEAAVGPPRPDGWTRPAFLRAHLAEMVRAMADGAKVSGYLHWTLTDNFEWGSYRPRFGLYGVDRRDGARIMDTDAQGNDAAAAYAEIVRALSPQRS